MTTDALPKGTRLLARLDDAVGRLVANAVADDVEVAARTADAGYTRFAENTVTQAIAAEEVLVRVRVLTGGRLGAATVESVAVDDIVEAGRRAAALAARSPRFPEHPGFSRSGQLVGPDRAHDAGTAAVARDPAARTAPLGRAFADLRAAGLEGAGLLSATDATLAVATAGGTRAVARTTLARCELVAAGAGSRGSGPSGFANDVAVRMADVDVAAVAARAQDVAVRARAPDTIAPGLYDVILEPRAVAEVMEWMAMGSFGSRPVEDGMSFLAGRAGQRVTGAAVTIVDDGTAEDSPTVPVAFDAEGTPRQRVVLLDRGVAGTPVHDRLSAARAGTTSTGHATPLDEDGGDGSLASSLVMAAGPDSLQDLLERVEQGLWITRFHYVNGLIDPRRAVMTGMTRDGVFRIQGGRLGAAVRNLRWTAPMLEALERIAGVTTERRAVPRWWSTGGAGGGGGIFLAPYLLIRAFPFTGQTG